MTTSMIVGKIEWQTLHCKMKCSRVADVHMRWHWLDPFWMEQNFARWGDFQEPY